MKRFVVFFLFLSLLFAFEDPPIREVVDYNEGIAPSLENFVLSREVEPMDFSNPIGYARMELLAVDPSVDDRISSEDEHYLIWTWGYLYGDRFEKIVGSGCGGHKDRDILEMHGDVEVEANITFSFKGWKHSVSTLATYVKVPFSHRELDRTNGRNRLKITLQGRMVFPYELIKIRWHEECEHDDEGHEHCHCEKDEYTADATIVKTFHDSLSYRVEGGRVLFFTFMPPITEQWKENNHINTLIFSKRKFYRIRFLIDGHEYGRRQLYTFYTTWDKYGVQHIHSSEDSYGDGESEEREEVTTPYLIEPRRESFCYIYRVDFPHYDSFGLHRVTLVARDHFLRDHEYTRNVLHREHSVGNYPGDSFYRPSLSLSFGEVGFSPLIFPFLFVVLLLLILWQ